MRVHTPVRYISSVESPQPDEADLAQSILHSLLYITDKTFADGGHALRPVHAKSHALLQGTLTVNDGLPPELAQGLFAKPGSYPVFMRLSSIAGDIMDDSVSLPRGLAIKVAGVVGNRLVETDDAETQDFLLVNGPDFGGPDAHVLDRNLRLLKGTSDRFEELKKVFSAFARGTQWALGKVGAESGKLAALGGQPETHPLGDTYYGQVPIRYGDHIAKFAIAPKSPSLRALADQPLNVSGKPNGLRDGISDFFSTQTAMWEFQVQLCTDLATMPVEDASVPWPETDSPFVAVAEISIGPQASWTVARSEQVDDAMSFQPWHCIAAHQPLGGVMRVRKPVYPYMVAHRSGLGRCPILEPRRDAVLHD